MGSAGLWLLVFYLVSRYLFIVPVKKVNKTLIIQTAFPGDVILATSVAESIHNSHPDIKIDMLVKQGNEQLFSGHPYIGNVITLKKDRNKFSELSEIIKKVRSEQYDLVINLHRFFSSGLITAFSKAAEKRGFQKNPLSRFFDKAFSHNIGDGNHEIDRNHQLIDDLCETKPAQPRLYPGKKALQNTEEYRKQKPYICIAPSSVWFTKQFPIEKWQEFISRIPEEYQVYLIGAPGEKSWVQQIADYRNGAKNLCGKLDLLSSAALMKDAKMNFVNDSAPLHLASATNAPVAAIFCSTIPDFGFGPLSTNSRIIEKEAPLPCRPCGLHGKKQCPEGHFACAYDIDVNRLLECL